MRGGAGSEGQLKTEIIEKKDNDILIIVTIIIITVIVRVIVSVIIVVIVIILIIVIIAIIISSNSRNSKNNSMWRSRNSAQDSESSLPLLHRIMVEDKVV